MALGLVVGAMCVPAPARAEPVSIYPACSVRILPGHASAEARCANPDLTYEYRIIIYCDLNPVEGYFYDYVVVSEWRPTTEVIRVNCYYGGWIIALLGPEFRQRQPF